MPLPWNVGGSTQAGQTAPFMIALLVLYFPKLFFHSLIYSSVMLHSPKHTVHKAKFGGYDYISHDYFPHKHTQTSKKKIKNQYKK